MVVQYAVYLYSYIPNPSTGLSPPDVFTRTHWEHKRFHDLHVWGNPVYVLNTTIADGKKIPCRQPRSERTVYMGPSPTHASSVPLVLGPSSGATSKEDVPNFGSEPWARLLGDSLSRYDNNNVDDTDHAMNQPMPSMREQQVSDSFEQHHPAPSAASVSSFVTQMSPTRKISTSSAREPQDSQMREPPAQEQVPVTPVLPVMPQREDLPTSTAECKVLPSLPNFCSNPRQSTHPRSTPKRLTTKAKFRATLPKGKTFSIILDSGLSQNIFNCKDDFVGPLKPAPWWVQVKGIAKGLKIEAVGHVMWAVLDTNGQLRCLKLPAYYIPAFKMRILSTTSYLETYNPEQICGDHTSLGFTGIPGNPTRGRIEGRVNPRNRIPTITGYEYNSCEFAVSVLNTTISGVMPT